MSANSTTTSSKPLTLYSATTGNGYQVTILLEELKAINPSLDYNLVKVDFPLAKTLQEPWFLKINPTATIPTLVDHSQGDFPVFETAAVLLHIAQHYDKEHVFWFDPQTEALDYSTMLQWIFFGHGGLGPIVSQLVHFTHFATEKVPYANERFLTEIKRLLKVLEVRLQDRDWLAGSGRGKYSLAEIKCFPLVNVHAFIGIETLDEYPNLKAWAGRNLARSAVAAGIKLPA